MNPCPSVGWSVDRNVIICPIRVLSLFINVQVVKLSSDMKLYWDMYVQFLWFLSTKVW